MESNLKINKKKPLVLFVADFTFYPVIEGDRKRVALLISAIRSWGYEVHYLALKYSFSEAEENGMRAGLDGLQTYEWKPNLDPWGRLQAKSLLARAMNKASRIIKQTFGLWPEPLDPDSQERCPDFFCKIVARKAQSLKPIAIIIEYLWLSRCLLGIPQDIIKVIDTHSAMHLRLKQYRGSGLYSYFHCTLKDELVCLKRADKILVIQEEERRVFAKYLRPDQLLLTPYAQELLPPPEHRDKTNNILFVGAPHGANIEGLKWFLVKVWPRIRKTVVDCHLLIAGGIGDIIQRDKSLARRLEQVEILGIVGDLTEVYHSSGVVIVPVLRGAGLKTKTVEALCHGNAVVSTSMGVDGISNIRDCEAVGVVDTPEGFATAVVEFLQSQHDYTQAALRFAQNNFSEDVAYKGLKSVLQAHTRKSEKNILR